MTTALTKTALTRDRSRRLLDISDTQLRIMNANAEGVLEGDTLFRVLRKKGDAEHMSKFFNRSLTEKQYNALRESNYREYIEELALEQKEERQEKGAVARKAAADEAKPREGQKKQETGAAGDVAHDTGKPEPGKAVERHIDPKQKQLAQVMNRLGKLGWTTREISEGVAACKELGLPDNKLVSMAKAGVEPEDARSFLRAHVEMGPLGWAMANSHHLFSFKVLIQMYEMVEYDAERFEEFVSFCTDHPGTAIELHEQMQLGNRGRLRDIRTAIGRMFEVFELTHSTSEDIRDLELLEELGPESHDRWPEGTLEEFERDVYLIAEAEEVLDWFNIPLCNDEERLAPDVGNENEPRRRRRGGF